MHKEKLYAHVARLRFGTVLCFTVMFAALYSAVLLCAPRVTNHLIHSSVTFLTTPPPTRYGEACRLDESSQSYPHNTLEHVHTYPFQKLRLDRMHHGGRNWRPVFRDSRDTECILLQTLQFPPTPHSFLRVGIGRERSC